MRIGTISLNINAPDFNYGAILHSWAFQQYLLKLPKVESTEIIDYTMPVLEEQDLQHPLLNSVLHFHPKTFIKLLPRIIKYHKRLKKFNEFINNHMQVSSVKYYQKTLDEAVLDYDTMICESDVIWSPGFCGGHFDKAFFLDLKSARSMNRIAYAPSMANGDLNDSQKNEITELLKCLNHISARETYEVEVLKAYTNKPVQHVLDPVLLLNADDYKEIIAERLVTEEYLLLYLPVDDNLELRHAAYAFANKNNLKVVEICTNLKVTNKSITTYTSAGVEEFLSLIKYAKYVFTNSFHAICFSVLFNIQFYAFSRNFSGKVRDICQVFGLEDYYFEDDIFIERELIKYETVNKRLFELKMNSVEWLGKALGIQ